MNIRNARVRGRGGRLSAPRGCGPSGRVRMLPRGPAIPGPAAGRGEVKATVPVGLDLPEDGAGAVKSVFAGCRGPSGRSPGAPWHPRSFREQTNFAPGLCTDRQSQACPALRGGVGEETDSEQASDRTQACLVTSAPGLTAFYCPPSRSQRT